MNELPATVESLSTKLDQLFKRHDQLLDESYALREENVILSKKIEEKEKELMETRDKNKVLALAQSIKEGSEKGTELKLKINEIVREIDRCIARLNE